MAAGLAFGTCAAAAQGEPRVKLATTAGDIVVEVYPDKAPKTAANFLQYVKDGFYNGTIFHRVIDGFMIQGGGMDEKMSEKPTRPPIEHEGRAALAKGLHNQVGYLAMARTNDPNSATAQFFINVVDNSGRLDPTASKDGYTVFGKVVSGMEVVNKIKSAPTGNRGMHADVPVTPIVITSATVLK
ncbi:MAG TPA: peptidylprolyl isomerase [Ramlibacter sp.]|nr:peptidylprolyl isomerase [Ramlibacter sp.]HVZ46828.1 peptidylprolyl isomerase [Ramlibacter sp.]